MSENSCERCGARALKLCAACATDTDRAAIDKVDAEMRSFSDQVRDATDVGDLVGAADLDDGPR